MIDLTRDPNLAMLEIAAEARGELCDSLVFIGGCATGLLVTATRAHPIRATEDVNVITKVATIRGSQTVENKLSMRGFKHDTSPDAPICRWIGAGVTLDLMPSDRVYSASTTAGISDDFLDALPGHLPGDAGSQSRLPTVVQRLRALAAL